MNALNYYVTCSHMQVLIGQQAYLTRQIVVFFDTRRHKWHSIEILVENETTEQMNNETAQQVSKINRF